MDFLIELLMAGFMKFYQIKKNHSGNRWVIGDIHACKKTLQTLVEEKIRLTREDQLFFLGDYINRGPDSVGVIDFIIQLQTLDYQVFTLRGNHEQMLLDSHYQSHSELELALPSLHKRNPLKDANRKILPQYVAFFENLPYYFDLGDYYLVHAGFNLSHIQPLADYTSMLWLKDFQYIAGKIPNKPIIYGHKSHSIADIQMAIKNLAQIIPLDNGCYKGLKREEGFLAEFGNLCAFNLDTLELLIQPCID